MKKEIKTEIDEAIADAIAEEEVKKEQQAEETKTYDFRDELEAQLKDAFSDSLKTRKENKVTIDLNEYLILKFKERDLERVVDTILAELRLSYNNEYLRIDNDDNVVDVIKVLYPDVYGGILEDLQNGGE